MASSPHVINIGRPTPSAPRLNVVSPATTGTIKLSSLAPKGLKSVNFGPGAEMLMNPKKQNSTSPSIQFEDLSFFRSQTKC